MIPNHNLPPTSLEKFLLPSAAPQPKDISELAHCGKSAGGKVSGGRAGKRNCGDCDNVMEQISGNGPEKLPESPASVAVSCAKIN